MEIDREMRTAAIVMPHKPMIAGMVYRFHIMGNPQNPYVNPAKKRMGKTVKQKAIKTINANVINGVPNLK